VYWIAKLTGRPEDGCAWRSSDSCSLRPMIGCAPQVRMGVCRGGLRGVGDLGLQSKDLNPPIACHGLQSRTHI